MLSFFRKEETFKSQIPRNTVRTMHQTRSRNIAYVVTTLKVVKCTHPESSRGLFLKTRTTDVVLMGRFSRPHNYVRHRSLFRKSSFSSPGGRRSPASAKKEHTRNTQRRMTNGLAARASTIRFIRKTDQFKLRSMENIQMNNIFLKKYKYHCYGVDARVVPNDPSQTQ